jgi:hypothetical protein
MKDENISQALKDWSRTVSRSLSETASSSNELTGDSSGSSKSETATETTIGRKRRFSAESANDLLFWGAHLLIVAISLGIMWVKMDGTNRALKELLKAQNAELEIARGEIIKADKAYEVARAAEQQRSSDVRTAQNTLTALVKEVHDNQASIKTNQDSIASIIETVNTTNQLILRSTRETETAALQSERAAQSAAGSAGVAAARASAAAATSGRTANVVASKVVTSGDKAQIKAQQQALVQKNRQLTRTIQRVKKSGPTFWDKLIH